ncbi:hypothetical protein F4827_002068 [Paraburkholderia bannensis]|uniref:Uncharacterized protein n=1 Tax=Paraburkholderia bannensis TaxID=765414 RepID=A0A7W9TW47_9BURK|nr:hypothetical protein [Paraburkholderia sp. WP4_3_2]MBB6102219.1 hypothetical protein [Paraburkholderia bannensis]
MIGKTLIKTVEPVAYSLAIQKGKANDPKATEGPGWRDFLVILSGRGGRGCCVVN